MSPRLASHGKDSGLTAGSSHQPLYVVPVARKNARLPPETNRNHDRIHHVRRSRHTQQPPRFVRFALAKRNRDASAQKSPELRLLWRPARLSNHRRRNERDDTEFQTRLMISPRPAVISIGGYQNRRVVHHGVHAGRRTVRGLRSCARILARAWFISSAVKRPCCLSHCATAARPARRRNASRAASVIQAETLTPSRDAARRIFS